MKTDQPSQNSYWVRTGRFAAGEYPGARDSAQAARKIEGLLDAGIDHFIDLTEIGELVPYDKIADRTASSLGLKIEWERHPIPDLSGSRTREQMRGILDAIDDALSDGKTVYVHCWGGVGRTGTVVGCWLVRHGHLGEEALQEIEERWQHKAGHGFISKRHDVSGEHGNAGRELCLQAVRRGQAPGSAYPIYQGPPLPARRWSA
ncbi:MAG: hypothetical protein F4X94_02810 [Dehalococcoidia bacterium]|nr:hypothetical protein [Dehalococcoidia bacterium]